MYEEIHRALGEHSKPEAEKRIIEIMKSYVYVLSRILNTKPGEVAKLIGLEESMFFYGELLQTLEEMK